MRRKPTLARIKSSEKVILDGRDDEALSTHLRIGTVLSEDTFGREAGKVLFVDLIDDIEVGSHKTIVDLSDESADTSLDN